MITIVDYGVGNLFSLESSFAAIGEKAVVTGDAERIYAADKIILPGVGAFGDAALKLKKTGLGEAVVSAARKGTPLMGICLGMQLLFQKSYEYGEHEGLGLIDGVVKPLEGRIPAKLKIPQIGWNALHFKKPDTLFHHIHNGAYVYFVHSYFADECEKDVIATTEYGMEVTAAVARENVWGCQFHPEKSGEVGLNILRAFCGEV